MKEHKNVSLNFYKKIRKITINYNLLFKSAYRQNQALLSFLKFQNVMTVIMILQILSRLNMFFNTETNVKMCFNLSQC